MARARNIKPAFFSNDELAEVCPLARLLFIALWTMADRAGRLEDRPKRIKVEALPYDDCDAEELLSELAEREFILRYARGGRRYIQVVNFAKHQNPHVREPDSEIPPPCDPEASPEAMNTGQSAEHSASTVQGNDRHRAGPADSGFLIPDSPSLIPDSGFHGEEGAQLGDESLHDGPPAGVPTKRGTRLPDGFPTADGIAWCRQERPDLDADLTAAKFRDYWRAVPGAKGTKLDWLATWRNFVRNEFVRRGRDSIAEHNRRSGDEFMRITDDGRTVDA